MRAWARKSGNKIIEVAKEKDYTKVVVSITKKGKEVAERSATRTNMSEPERTR